MKTNKKTTLPKKPVTKRDKHFYDLGAEQQAEVFVKTFSSAYDKIDRHADEKWQRFYGKTVEIKDEIYPGAIRKMSEKEFSRKSLGDYQEPITNKDYTWHIIAVLVFVGIILLAHPYIMSAF